MLGRCAARGYKILAAKLSLEPSKPKVALAAIGALFLGFYPVDMLNTAFRGRLGIVIVIVFA
jgi:hypothetical protein